MVQLPSEQPVLQACVRPVHTPCAQTVHTPCAQAVHTPCAQPVHNIPSVNTICDEGVDKRSYVQSVNTSSCTDSNCAQIVNTRRPRCVKSVHSTPVKIIKCGSTMDAEMMKTNVYSTNNNVVNKSEEFRPRSKSDVASRPHKRPNFLSQLKMQRKSSCTGGSHRPMSPLVQVPLTIQENPKCEDDKKDTGVRPRSKSDAASILQRRMQRKNGTTTNPGLSQIQENPGRGGEKQCIEEEGQVQPDDLEDDDLKPQPRRRAATASQADESEFRERATSLGQSARARVSSIVRKLRHRSSDSTPGEEKKKKIKYYPSSEFVLDAKGGRGSTDNEIRRRTASLSTPHRASDVQVDPAQSAILFRDARGLPALDPFITVDTYQILKNDETKIFAKFFGFHMCYDLIPTSAKLVVFDTQLLVKKAFFALVYNGVRAAPLWDSQQQRFVGMLTITDFIRILAMNYKSPSLEMEELEEHRLETWRNVLKDVKELIFIEPNASLYEAIKSLIHNKIHRLPVIDSTTGNVLYILTHKRILRFLFLYINDLPESSLLHQSVHQLNIGTYDDIEVASEDTPIIEALHKFVNKRISALPIVDKEHRLIDIYAKFDVINLAAEKTYSNLDVSLKEANKHRNEWFEGVHKCTKADTLFEVMDKIVKAEVHRLVIVDESNVVCGMISLSDILNFLVLRPGGDDFFKKSVAETIKTEPNMSEQDDILNKQESAETTSLEKLNNPNLGSKPDEIQPEKDRAINLSQESALSAEKKIELTCEEINEDPGVQSFDASDDVVENRESEDRSLEMNQDPAGDRLTATLDEQDQVTNIILPPLFIESASNSTPSSSPDPGRDLSAPCSPCPPTSSPCPPTSSPCPPTSSPCLPTSSPCLTIISNDDRPTTPVTMTKEFGKSDSMDSAFEATEEVDEEEPDAVEANDNGGNANFSQDERLVHIQIVDAGGTTTPPATPSPPPPTTFMGKLCDNDMAGGNTTVLSCDMTGHTQSNKLQQILP